MRRMLFTALLICTALCAATFMGMSVNAIDGSIPVYVDIKPGSWPNTIKIDSKGVFAVAVCGTGKFDVMTIDPTTVRIFVDGDGAADDGVAPLRWSYKDVATPYTRDDGGGHALGGDGYLDLVLIFDTPTVVADSLTRYCGGTGPLIIRGHLLGDTPISGQDLVRVLPVPEC